MKNYSLYMMQSQQNIIASFLCMSLLHSLSILIHNIHSRLAHLYIYTYMKNIWLVIKLFMYVRIYFILKYIKHMWYMRYLNHIRWSVLIYVNWPLHRANCVFRVSTHIRNNKHFIIIIFYSMCQECFCCYDELTSWTNCCVYIQQIKIYTKERRELRALYIYTRTYNKQKFDHK